MFDEFRHKLLFLRALLPTLRTYQPRTTQHFEVDRTRIKGLLTLTALRTPKYLEQRISYRIVYIGSSSP